ncbi:MAG TPA: signal recognition particle-docking protein FtsY [Ilumatobacteraceae bacterium]|nr:signal recognition particle-docking protein FtsY [Ilumatobacteraceae bacterium]
MEWIFLVLAIVVVAFGVGVLVVSRQRNRAGRPVPPPDAGPITAPPRRRPVTDVEVEELPAVEDAPVLEDVPVIEPVRPASLRERMAKARSALTGAFVGVLGRSAITDDTWDELEEALLRADVGVTVTDALIDDLKTRVKAKEITEPAALLDALQADMAERLAGADRTLRFEDGPVGSPNVWLFVGVNGVGKTTTIGKIASQQTELGRSVLMAAGDTFRAAAAEQLGAWAERAGVELVRGDAGGDPSAVIYDGIERAAARDIDLVLADTAGRLHTKTNLMDELRKVRRVADKGVGQVTETLLVIDATTGQNGLAQAREFGEATQVTGVVLTKLDGSAKGGIVFAIETELGIPIKLVGVGETIGDLVAFEPTEFVAGLFDR